MCSVQICLNSLSLATTLSQEGRVYPQKDFWFSPVGVVLDFWSLKKDDCGFLQVLLNSLPSLYVFASLYLSGRLRLKEGPFCDLVLLSEGISSDFPPVTVEIAESSFEPKRLTPS